MIKNSGFAHTIYICALKLIPYAHANKNFGTYRNGLQQKLIRQTQRFYVKIWPSLYTIPMLTTLVNSWSNAILVPVGTSFQDTRNSNLTQLPVLLSLIGCLLSCPANGEEQPIGLVREAAQLFPRLKSWEELWEGEREQWDSHGMRSGEEGTESPGAQDVLLPPFF